MRKRASTIFLRFLLSLALGLFSGTAAWAQANIIVPVVSASPSIFATGERSNLFLTIANENQFSNRNIQSGDAFQIHCFSGRSVSVRPREGVVPGLTGLIKE